MQIKHEKNYNIELLRIISMLMILFLHYLNQGKVLELTDKTSMSFYLIWIIEAFCHVSVNLYMFISGYYLGVKEYSWRRFISFYTTIFFYSACISVFCFLTNISELNFENIIKVFPIIGSKSNWYVTCYAAILLVSPLLNIIIRSIRQDVFKRILIIQFILFSVYPTIGYCSDPFIVKKGYSILWFSFVYLLAGYIRKYSVCLSCRYSVFMMVSIGILPICKFWLPAVEKSMYAYNSIPVFIASYAIFVMVVNNKRTAFSTITPWVTFLGKTSFGVFFIHSFVLIRDKLWIFMGSTKYINSLYQVVHGLFCIVFIYIICSIIDGFRLMLFDKLGVNKTVNQLSKYLDKAFQL
ncbi:acyltransferase family protein [Butyrivibrio sp. MC2013]|uniref:acyltransferase n=1 Tax=Butyrivibrio sp. MC2013 TaxID=1280686 RepID=UPI000403B009